jgi:hypothetical protein
VSIIACEKQMEKLRTGEAHRSHSDKKQQPPKPRKKNVNNQLRTPLRDNTQYCKMGKFKANKSDDG